MLKKLRTSFLLLISISAVIFSVSCKLKNSEKSVEINEYEFSADGTETKTKNNDEITMYHYSETPPENFHGALRSDSYVTPDKYENGSEDEKFIYTEKNGKILKSRVIPYEEGKYSYKAGDEVIFSPVCTDLEIQSLTYNGNLVIGHKYKVVRIINYYYLELLNEKGEVSNPIRFCNIQKVDTHA